MSTCPVYVIDDDPSVLNSTKFLLGTLGYDCSIFQEPATFLDQLADLFPGCIFTDLGMPNMSGFELRQMMLSVGIEWPMILMSGDYGPADEKKAKAIGFLAVLRKPFDAQTLKDSLDQGHRKLMTLSA